VHSFIYLFTYCFFRRSLIYLLTVGLLVAVSGKGSNRKIDPSVEHCITSVTSADLKSNDFVHAPLFGKCCYMLQFLYLFFGNWNF